MKKKGLRIFVLLAGILILMLIPAAGYADEVSQGDSGLADYTQRNGWEESSEIEPITVNPVKRSSAPLMTQYLAVFIEFPDEDTLPISLTKEEIMNNAEILLNTGQGTMTSIANAKHKVVSFKEYVERYTYGKLSVTTSFFPKDESGKTVSYLSPKPRKYYMPYSQSNPEGYRTGSQRAERERELIESAFNEAKKSIESEFSADQLDVNQDGFIDGISFFAESPRDSLASWGDLLWSHKADASFFGCSINGKELGAYNMINTALSADNANSIGSVFSLNRGSYSTIIHEYFHTLGMPDLYRGNYPQTQPVGNYDLMAVSGSSNPSGLLSYMTSEYNSLRWNAPPQKITSSQTVTVSRPTYVDPEEKRSVKIISPYSSKEFFVVEYYSNKVNDITAPVINETGLLVYRVNTAVSSSNIEADTSGEKDFIYVFRPNEPSKGYGSGDLNQATLGKGTGRLTFGSDQISGDWDNNTLYYADGRNSGIVLEIKQETEDTITFDVKIPSVSGQGTKSDPFIICEADDLNLLAGKSDCYFKLNNDLDLSNMDSFPAVPFFSGVFDGNGKTIDNLTIKNGDGMFASINPGGEVKNLKLKNVHVTGGNSHTGAVAGQVYGKLTNVGVLSGSVSVTVPQNNEFNGAGGIAGTLGESGTIESCYSSAQVTGTQNTGGLIGLNQNGIIRNCYANGRVSGGADGGGLIGTQLFWGVSTYKVPQDALFDIEKTGQIKGAGKISGNVPGGLKGDEGLTGCKMEKFFSLDLSKKPSCPVTITTSPAGTAVPYTVQSDSPKTVVYSSGNKKLVAKGVGKAKIQVLVGTMKMPLSASVTVVDTGVHVYQIHYRLNGGKNHKANPASYGKNKVVLKNPTRSKYLFKGWYTDSKYKKRITTINPSDRKQYVLYAKWEKVKVSKVGGLRLKNSGKKKLKVSYKKIKGADGYQILYGRNKKITKGRKTVNVSGASKTLSKLKKGTSYYVKVRAYKKDSRGVKVYGAYSKTVKVKIKR